jgi:ribonuclease E
MLINTVEGQECRIAIVESGILEELYMERASSGSHVGNIYKGRVTNVEPAIQAAFVDFGLAKNGFLHISDVYPRYFPKSEKTREAVGAKRPRRERPAIQACLRRGQELLVQITKEGMGTKGPTLTTYLSLPGRLLVMMPGMSRMGVSKKVEDEEARIKARQALSQLKLPANMGFIIRTAGIDRSKRELQRDLNYLLRLWQAVDQRAKSVKSPAAIYRESDLVIRTLRDVYNSDIERIICDNEAVAFTVQEFLNMAMPRTKNVIELYTGKRGLFYDCGLEDEIEKIYARRVELPSGGYLIIDQTEALVAIDVNSGRFREHTDAETTALKTDLEAAREIVRQLRLRDLGGVIVIDFIDLREDKHRREVETNLREALRRDRAKTKMLRMSSFGVVEMTRQRVRPSLEHSIHVPCEHCSGTGFLKSEESQALHVMRCLQRLCANEDAARIEVAVTPTVAHHISNVERTRLHALEKRAGKEIIVRAAPSLAGNEVQFTCTNTRGVTSVWEEQAPEGKGKAGKLETIDIRKLKLAGEAKPVAAAPAEGPARKKKGRRGRRGGRKFKRKAHKRAGKKTAEQGKANRSG